MGNKELAFILSAGAIGFWLGGGSDAVKYENPEIEFIYKTLELDKPYLPEDCKNALLTSTQVQFERDEDLEAYTALVNSCFDTTEANALVTESEASLVRAFNNYEVGDSDGLTEDQVEEAFDECEIDYGDSEYCEDNLEDYLSED
jgi:hypothetical protein